MADFDVPTDLDCIMNQNITRNDDEVVDKHCSIDVSPNQSWLWPSRFLCVIRYVIDKQLATRSLSDTIIESYEYKHKNTT